MNKTEKLVKAHKDATDYVSKIGKSQHHLQRAGRLHELKIETQINHQFSPGDTNYWNDKEFDQALAEVVAQNFLSLADEALKLMKKRADMSLLEEKAYLQDRLAQIEQIEIEERSPVEGFLAGD